MLCTAVRRLGGRGPSTARCVTPAGRNRYHRTGRWGVDAQLRGPVRDPSRLSVLHPHRAVPWLEDHLVGQRQHPCGGGHQQRAGASGGVRARTWASPFHMRRYHVSAAAWRWSSTTGTATPTRSPRSSTMRLLVRPAHGGRGGMGEVPSVLLGQGQHPGAGRPDQGPRRHRQAGIGAPARPSELHRGDAGAGGLAVRRAHRQAVRGADLWRSSTATSTPRPRSARTRWPGWPACPARRSWSTCARPRASC